MTTRTTELKVKYDLTDTKALEDSQPSTPYNQPFANINRFKEPVNVDDCMTLEHNYSVLDGSLNEFNDPKYSFFSNEMSTSTGKFKNNPYIDIKFTGVHSSFALTLSFNGQHPLSINVHWYGMGAKLQSKSYNVNSNTYTVDTDVQEYDHIVIEFTKTLPFHYVKMSQIKYGTVLLWDETILNTGKLIKDSNAISDRLAVDSLTFNLNDKNNEMNFGNITGLQNYFQRKQPIYPVEYVNGVEIPLGKFYLDKVSNNKNIVKVEGVSLLGLLNDSQFIDGTIYDGIKAGKLLEYILNNAGIKDYHIDKVTYNQLIYGTLKPQSTRNALQQILFACNSVIDTSQLEGFKIYKPSPVIKSPITRNNKFTTSISANKYISAVEVQYDEYQLDTERTEISKGVFSGNKHRVIFDSPYANVQVENGTILKQSTYYVDFEPKSKTAEVIITGLPYNSTKQSVVKERKYLQPWQSKYVKKFTTQLCNATTASDLAEKLLHHYTDNELTVKVKFMANDTSMGNIHEVENSSVGMGNYLATFRKRNIDLTGGFIDNAEMIGYFNTQDSKYFSGNELYTGEEGFGDTII